MCQNFFCSAEDLNKDEHSNFHSAEHKSKPECHKKPSYRGAFMFFLLVFLSLHPSSSLSSPCLLSSIFLCSLSLPSLLHTHSLTHIFTLFSLSHANTFFFNSFFSHSALSCLFRNGKYAHTLTQRKNNRYVCRHACKHRQHTHTRTQCGVR